MVFPGQSEPLPPVEYGGSPRDSARASIPTAGDGGVVRTDRPEWMRVFRSYSLFAEWADLGSSSQRMGMTTVKLEGQLAFPFFTEESPLLVTPSHETRFIRWEGVADFPDIVHASELHFRWLKPLAERFQATVAVAPSWNSDYRQDSSDALRITGQVAGIWKFNPRSTFLFGVSYLDRSDVRLLPVGGLLWRPREDLEVDLLFPQPKIAQRFRWWGEPLEEETTDWLYVGGGLTGGIWAIERADSSSDVATYRDYRIVLGAERRTKDLFHKNKNKIFALEVGYLFERLVRYESNTSDVHPGGVFMVGLRAVR
jgi:hypothetical protein